ncbi:TetR family transcriptional regulator (plasmid) [Novosphingobium pentaromativorans US6-1]|nr:TetR family transcriptional regulator [Novosphingobium pentaromativorans US6-1]
MARPQAADYEERREAILDRAAELFAKSGFPSATVSDIARACNASKSLLYHYYRSKEEVLFGVMSSHIDDLVDEVVSVCEGPGTARERLTALLRRFMKHYVGAASRQKVLLNDLNHLPDDKRQEIVAKQRRIIDAVQALLVEIDPALAESAGEARAQTMLLFGMINWSSNWYDPDGPVSPDRLADMAFAMVAPDR